MIIGSGLIAKILSNINFGNNLVVHVAGVSNSLCEDRREFDRELELVYQSISYGKPILYFSSQGCRTLSGSSPYYQHKKYIEDILLNHSSDHKIIRIPQLITPGGNPSNLLNYFNRKLQLGEVIYCDPNAYRNMIADRHLTAVVQEVIRDELSGLLGFCAPFDYSALEIVRCMEILTGKKANIEMVQKKHDPAKLHMTFYCSEDFKNLSDKLFIRNRDNYLEWAVAHGTR